LARGLDQASGRVELAVARKDGELHAGNPGRCRGLPWSGDRGGAAVNARATTARPARAFAPPARAIKKRRPAHGARRRPRLKGVMGIEPTLSAWEAEVLPLNYTRAGRQSMLAARRMAIRIGGRRPARPAKQKGPRGALRHGACSRT